MFEQYISSSLILSKSEQRYFDPLCMGPDFIFSMMHKTDLLIHLDLPIRWRDNTLIHHITN